MRQFIKFYKEYIYFQQINPGFKNIKNTDNSVPLLGLWSLLHRRLINSDLRNRESDFWLSSSVLGLSFLIVCDVYIHAKTT